MVLVRYQSSYACIQGDRAKGRKEWKEMPEMAVWFAVTIVCRRDGGNSL